MARKSRTRDPRVTDKNPNGNCPNSLNMTTLLNGAIMDKKSMPWLGTILAILTLIASATAQAQWMVRSGRRHPQSEFHY
jgi:hypothetical protein